MSTVPVPAGDVAVICVAESTVNEACRRGPRTRPRFAPVSPVPVIVTEVPPACGPLFGLTPVTVGGGLYVNWSALEVAVVPAGVVTVMSTVPVPAGETAVI